MKQLFFIFLAFISFSAKSQLYMDSGTFGSNSVQSTMNNNPEAFIGVVNIFDDVVNGWNFSEIKYTFKDSLRWKQNQIIGLQDSLNLKLNKTSIASWAKQPTKPTYVWSEIGDRPTIPSNQTLSISGSTLSISDGNSVTLPSTAIIISNPTRSFNTNFNVINTTLVFYSIKIENGTALVSATTGTAYLEYSVNGGTSWVTVSQVMREENGLSLLNINTKGSTFVLSGIIPGGSLARIRINALAGSSISLLSTQENAF